jgi:hypothetical protein
MNKHYSPLIQIQAMKTCYPQFVARRLAEGKIEWIGNLSPSPRMRPYEVSIVHAGDARPKVRILTPPIKDNAPHRHADGTLCLYHPDNFKWSRSKLISKYIVPWTIGWIYFYEVWLEHGEWIGPEAEHTEIKAA